MANEKQVELPFDDAEIWERVLGESAHAYSAFCAYRDLGPKRTVRAAFKSLNGAAKTAPNVNVPGSWKRWIRKWQWADRVRAFDKAKEDQLGFEIAELRRERLKQRLELDRDVHYPQIIALNKKIDELIQIGLAKTTSVNPNTGITQSLDRAQAFQFMAAERRELEQAYFDLARPLLEAPAGKTGEGEDPPVARIGRFEWVPDPDVPEPAPVPAAEPPKKGDE